MKYNQLGSSTIEVSEISMGCMSLNTQDPNSATVISKALDQGINFFDTADLYEQGKNEEMLGKAIAGKRKDVIVATKVGNQWTPGKEGWQWNPTKEYIITAIEDSLRRLKTDYIDLYQLHGGTIDDPIDEIIEAFEILKRHGKIRAYGISSIRPNVIREFSSRSNISSVMMQYSLLDRRPAENCLDLLADSNISVITRGALAKGLLVGKPAQSYLSHNQAEVKEAANQIMEIGRKTNRSEAEIAAAYVLNHPAVASAVIGFRTIDQLNSFSKHTDLALSHHEYECIDSVVEPTKYEAHR